VPTALVVGLALLGLLVALVLGLAAVFNRQARRTGALVALGLAAAALLLGSWGLGFIFRATAPVPGDVLLFGASSDQTVVALSARDATTRWSVSVAPAELDGPLVEQDGVVYVSTFTGVEALAAGDGHQLWQSTTAIQVEPGSIAGGVLYGASVQNGQTSSFVAALDVATGHQLWRATGLGLGPAGIGSNLLPVEGVVLVGDEHGQVRALDTTSGGLRWQVALPTTGPVLWLTADRAGMVYGIAQEVGVVQPALAFALDPQTQVVRWQHAFSAPSRTKSRTTNVLPFLTVSGGALYVGTSSALVALDAASGRQRWQYSVSKGVSSPIVVDQGIAYFGSIGGFSAVRTSDGTALWTHADSSSLGFGTALLSHGVVFAHAGLVGPQPWLTLDSGQHDYAFRASDGYQYYRH
jgi:outer membrane protein assembly factor BamB